uniref:Uncharacterized protein LOC104220216 n=1 Tax=Nicotiana sylvestris TaxID=4096 RepID=A0A1U7W3Y7_NICSY|nr:PREDICTED: uncharacterized protein LOC104220216 [Nicotiana sylvestris]
MERYFIVLLKKRLVLGENHAKKLPYYRKREKVSRIYGPDLSNEGTGNVIFKTICTRLQAEALVTPQLFTLMFLRNIYARCCYDLLHRISWFYKDTIESGCCLSLVICNIVWETIFPHLQERRLGSSLSLLSNFMFNECNIWQVGFVGWLSTLLKKVRVASQPNFILRKRQMKPKKRS